MITGEIKSKIDGIWETFWTGGLTNPLSVVEQVTYLLFIKLLDDNQLRKESNAARLGATTKDLLFKEGNYVNEELHIDVPYKDLRWSTFKDFEPTEMFANIKDNVFPFIKGINNGKDTAFTRYMKDAIFMIPTPRVLIKVIDGLSDPSLDLNNKDIMGDVYEYLLAKIASSGTNGQFRTPRHIIKMMVDLMKPSLGERVCDPAMGSAGFIVESARFISDNYKDELLKKENLSNYATKMFSGFDTDQTMLRIGAMNMMLHGVDDPNIKYQDSLSDENLSKAEYDLILANPPFKGSLDYDAVAKDLLAVTKTKKTEILFLTLFIRMLKLGGRCASVVPDGVLTNKTTKAFIELRKELVENHMLHAVITMPSGVFKPYAGVSTAVMIFTKTGTGGTDKVWFYEMKADGYSLDDKRESVEENDIPDILARFKTRFETDVSRSKTDQSFFVSKQEIMKNDYDLSIKRYKEIVYEKIEYEDSSVILNRIEVIDNEIEKLMRDLKNLLSQEG